MNTQSIIGVLMVIVGAALFYFGYHESQSVGEQVFETFTDRFTDSTTWYLIGGTAAAAVGVILLTVKRGRPAN